MLAAQIVCSPLTNIVAVLVDLGAQRHCRRIMRRLLEFRVYLLSMGGQDAPNGWDEGRPLATCLKSEPGGHFYRPKNPPNRLPPAPPLPCLAASVSIHFFKKARFFRSSSLETLVSCCGSCLSNANNVGIELIMYRKGMPPTPPRSGLSISTSTNETPPSSSPIPSFSTSSLIKGATILHELHQLVFQRVKSGVLVLADMSRRVCSSSSERTGAGKMRFFACDARVVENCLVAVLAGDARNSLEAKEMCFMMGAGVRSGYGKVWIISTTYTSTRMVSVRNRCRSQEHQCVQSGLKEQ